MSQRFTEAEKVRIQLCLLGYAVVTVGLLMVVAVGVVRTWEPIMLYMLGASIVSGTALGIRQVLRAVLGWQPVEVPLRAWR